MKKSILAGVSAVALSLTPGAHAIPISGNIGFTGGVRFDTSSAGSATEVVSWVTPVSLLVSGAFASITPGTMVTFASPWSFNTTTPIASFWSVAGFSFDLTASSILTQGFNNVGIGYVAVTGTGTVSGNGYDDTPMIWNFTSQDPRASMNPDTWTFSASAASTAIIVGTTDGGATVLLMGLGLLGTFWMSKRFPFFAHS